MTAQQNHDPPAEGEQIIGVVRDTVQQLELLTERLKTFLDDEVPPDLADTLATVDGVVEDHATAPPVEE